MIKRVKVTQVDVARRAKVNRCTVSKILNNFPERVSEDTKRRVFQAAIQVGYLHPAVVKVHRRKAPRQKLKANASVKVYLKDGSLFSKCQGTVVNISSSGMLLESLKGGKGVLPIEEPFYLEITLTDSKLQITKRKAKPIRFVHQQDKLGLGIQLFDSIKPDQLRKLAL